MNEARAARFVPEAALPLYRLLVEQGNTPREAMLNVFIVLRICIERSTETPARKRQKGTNRKARSIEALREENESA